MSPETYDVYFSGVTLKNADPAEAKRKIGAMFKLKGEKLERLFSGKPIPIKRGVDMDRAVKFRVAFRDVGALVDIVPAGQPAPEPAARSTPAPRPATSPAGSAAIAQTAASTNRPAQSGDSGFSLADGPLPVSAERPAESIPVPDYGLSAPKDFSLSDCAAPVEPAPIPDISALGLDKAGAILDESPAPQPLEIDTETLELNAPGTTLIEQEEVRPAQIDTDQLSMSAANEGSLEEYQKPVEAAPLPNIDHLQLDEAKEKPKARDKASFVIADD
ncbi:MAG: hypothetical protein PVI92_06960 [Chromatiales bacterium]|jgi:hypothetical protein